MNEEFQLLRAISMLVILLGHMPLQLPNCLMHGYSFVTLFFVLSGYLAAVQFKKKYHTGVSKAVILKAEMLNRFYRLAPLMSIWILIYFMIGNLIGYFGGVRDFRSMDS